jgi:hypothetical protein
MSMLEKVRLTEAEEIKAFLTVLRADGADPGSLAVLLPWLSVTGGALSGHLNKVLETIRSDASVRARAKQVGGILAQVLARDVRNF